MIQELKIKNVLSFKNEVTWYAIASLWRSVWI